MLDHAQAQPRQVEHLAALHPCDRCQHQVGAALAAATRGVPDHLIRLGDHGQMSAGSARLLAGPAPLGLFVGATLGPRGLAKPIRGRRLGGVRRVLAEPTLQLGQPRLQRDDQVGLFGVGRAQLGDHHGLDRDGGFQLRVGRRDRGLHNEKRSSPLARGPYQTAIPHAPDRQLVHRGNSALA
jgi:hypothetical protein